MGTKEDKLYFQPKRTRIHKLRVQMVKVKATFDRYPQSNPKDLLVQNRKDSYLRSKAFHDNCRHFQKRAFLIQAI